MESIHPTVRFGPYELDFRAHQLRKHGLTIKLQPKVFDVLSALVRKPGYLISREELKNDLWSEGLFIDFENSLNAAITKLRVALSDSPARPRYVETVPRQGYRFIGSIQSEPKVPAKSRWMLAVLPFENLSREADDDYFSEGLTEEMITQLGKINPERLGVIARTTVISYIRKGKDPAQVGRELSVDFILEGTVRRVEDQVRIAAQLVQVSDSTQLWSASYDRALSDILALQGQVAQAIARGIKVRIKPQRRAKLSSPAKVNPAAYEDYLKGRYFWNKVTEQGYRRSVDLFKRAANLEPDYALAYSGLADSYVMLADSGISALPPREVMPKAKKAATRALQIDDTLAEAHASLALVHWRYHRNWLAAEKEFRIAIELNPSYANGHMLYSWFLAAAVRLDEAIERMEQARSLDPLSLMINSNVGLTLTMARKYGQAMEQLHRTNEMDPNFALTHYVLGEIHAVHVRFSDAISEFLAAVRLSGESPFMIGALGLGYGLAGKKEEARNVLHTLQRLSKRRFVSAFAFASVYAGMEAVAKANAWFEKAFEERASYLAYIAVDPFFDSMRGDHQFSLLLNRVGAPEPI